MVALQLPVTIDFLNVRTRFPSQARKSAFEYSNNQRAFETSPDHPTVIGAFLSSKEESLPLIHRTQMISGASLNSSVKILKPQHYQPNQLQRLKPWNSLRRQKLSCWYHRNSSPDSSVSFQISPKWYQHSPIRRRPSTSDCLPHMSS